LVIGAMVTRVFGELGREVAFLLSDSNGGFIYRRAVLMQVDVVLLLAIVVELVADVVLLVEVVVLLVLLVLLVVDIIMFLLVLLVLLVVDGCVPVGVVDG